MQEKAFKIDENNKELIIEIDKMNAIFEDIFVPLLLIDSAQNIIKINKAASALVGRFNNLHEAVPEITDKIREFQNDNSINVNINTIINKHYVHIQATRIAEKETLVILQDVSKEHFLAAQLQQAQKMEPIGQFASGIAHDFNNILTVIGGYTNIIKKKINDNSVKEYLKHISSAIEKGVTMIRNLLNFSRESITSYNVKNLNDIVNDTISMAERLLSENIFIAAKHNAKRIFAKIDEVQIEQCLLNLITNAQDAMPDGGNITILLNIFEDSDFIEQNFGKNNTKYAEIIVEDTGTGMDKKVLDHIFDPFYTTKPPKKGTGLGLAMVNHIMKQHEGMIMCESKPQEGTSFKLYLPICEE